MTRKSRRPRSTSDRNGRRPRLEALAILPLLLAGEATAVPDFVRFRGGPLLVGSTPEEIFALAGECAIERSIASCRPEQWTDEVRPLERRRVFVRPFELHRREVSVGDYRRCEVLGKCAERTWASEPAHFPVVRVTFADASDYCRSIGARLPSETEFEWAARGPARRAYANASVFVSGSLNVGSPPPLLTDESDGYRQRAPTESLRASASPEGVLHLSGNVEEWTSSVFDAADGSVEAGRRVVKGGHFASSHEASRGAARVSAFEREATKARGFRCAR